jgi:hypothetical protein
MILSPPQFQEAHDELKIAIVQLQSLAVTSVYQQRATVQRYLDVLDAIQDNHSQIFKETRYAAIRKVLCRLIWLLHGRFDDPYSFGEASVDCCWRYA